MIGGIKFLKWARARALCFDINHPVRHLHGLHRNEETKWGRGGRLPRLVISLILVTSTAILVIAFVQPRGADYIYRWVSSMHEPLLLLESAITDLKTLVQSVC